MKRIVFMVTVAVVMALMMAVAGPASATIHPLVESADCANFHAGDPAEVPGQDPEVTTHSDQSSLRALSVTSDGFTDFSSPPYSDFKFNGECGAGVKVVISALVSFVLTPCSSTSAT